MAVWEAVLLPEWRWEAYEKETDDIYRGRVKPPNTYGNWEYGSFTQDELETAGAYRVDTEINSDEPLYPDGGSIRDELEPQQNDRDDYHR